MHVYAEGKHRKVYVGKDGKYFYNLNGVRVYTRKKPIRGSPKTKKDCPKYGVRKSDGKCKKKPGRKPVSKSSARRSSTKNSRSTRRKTERECRPYGVRKSDGQCRKKPGRKPGSKNRVKTTSPKRASPKRATKRASPKTKRASPKTKRASPKTKRASPKRTSSNTTRTSPKRKSSSQSSAEKYIDVPIVVNNLETEKASKELQTFGENQSMKILILGLTRSGILPAGYRAFVYPEYTVGDDEKTVSEWLGDSDRIVLTLEKIDENTDSDDEGYIYNRKWY